MCGYDSDIQDLVEAIHKGYEDAENALNLMKTLRDKFKSTELEIAAREYATENSLCYDCECEMEVDEWSEKRPYGDTFASERFTTKVCPECGLEIGVEV
jgi:hypothetical protein